MVFCVGATKAGTSWLYRALHDHPDCAVKAVKEIHYWDTFDAGARERQLTAFGQRLAEIRAMKAKAEAAGEDWRVANLSRREADTAELIAMVGADRTGDAAYLDYLTAGAQGRLVADITPGYGLLGRGMLARMAERVPGARWVYLLRDPLERLWSHVRMQAKRNRAPGEDHAEKANGILRRMVQKGEETHILARGDYAAAVDKLRALVPGPDLRVDYCERLFTQPGWERMCAHLGIAPTEARTDEIEHAGQPARMDPGLRAPALGLVRAQYDWAAREMGPLPETWARNLAEVDA